MVGFLTPTWFVVFVFSIYITASRHVNLSIFHVLHPEIDLIQENQQKRGN
jgi:hypothetical protein